MREIHIVQLDKRRPALIMTNESQWRRRDKVTVAPITSTIKGLSTEVIVDERNGIDHESVVSCDNLVTVPRRLIDHHTVGWLQTDQEAELTAAILSAFRLL